MTARALDSAEVAIITACRERLLDALMPVMEAQADALMREGHAEFLVCQGMVSAAAEMVGHIILDNTEPADAAALWGVTAELIEGFICKNAAVAAGLLVPAGTMVQ